MVDALPAKSFDLHDQRWCLVATGNWSGLDQDDDGDDPLATADWRDAKISAVSLSLPFGQRPLRRGGNSLGNRCRISANSIR